jgi:2-C-methyl-D-erythritol 4-phosphate cytidylyltransferase/2-C-methyl-D-erythritol 2,4-cyclodiphosphate synthase
MKDYSAKSATLKNAAIVVAAGSGVRASSASGLPKQYASIGGEMVLTHTLRAFASHPDIGLIVTVIRAGDEALYVQAAAGLGAKLAARLGRFVAGGATRQQSVHNGLKALAAVSPERVLIHDAARPFVDHGVISRVIGALDGCDAALAAVPVADTLKREENGAVAATVDRAGLWRAQTPQGFRYRAILEAHEAAEAASRSDFTDDSAIAEWRGMAVALALGSEANSKITTAEDLALAERLVLAGRLAGPQGAVLGEDVCTGGGFDAHAFEAGDHVMLCGVRVPHGAGLAGHSDADVALHALTDAVLGAIGAGDIGAHFPPSDQQWRGAASHVFLARAAELVREKGGRIVNVDVTIICERPKIGPHREAMRRRIAGILGLAAERVNVKATTTEKLGFAGRGEGIAAMAQAAVAAPRRA